MAEEKHTQTTLPRGVSGLLIRAREAATLSVLVCACVTQPGERPRETGAQAELRAAREATEASDWAAAAARWKALFRKGGPEAANACREASRALLALGEPERARAMVDAGLSAHPDDPLLLEAKGNVLAVLGFRRAAEGCYDEALARDPGRNSALLARAMLRLELGLLAAARADLERCLQQGARDGRTWLCYARTLAALGERRQAFDSFARAFELGDQDLPCLLAAAGLYFDDDFGRRSTGDREHATAWLQRAVALDPHGTQAHYWLALLHEERGDVDAAVTSLGRSVEADPMHLAALERLAELLHARGERELAAEMARRALQLERRPEKRRALEELLDQPAQTTEGAGSTR